mmetsp:Transcript_69833/g.130472  ORF Transcript_69833/g.130472 Transcript_69833/m.130472 type:complete len:276 (+) Transcript_69833:31-858(+)
MQRAAQCAAGALRQLSANFLFRQHSACIEISIAKQRPPVGSWCELVQAINLLLRVVEQGTERNGFQDKPLQLVEAQSDGIDLVSLYGLLKLRCCVLVRRHLAKGLHELLLQSAEIAKQRRDLTLHAHLRLTGCNQSQLLHFHGTEALDVVLEGLHFARWLVKEILLCRPIISDALHQLLQLIPGVNPSHVIAESSRDGINLARLEQRYMNYSRAWNILLSSNPVQVLLHQLQCISGVNLSQRLEVHATKPYGTAILHCGDERHLQILELAADLQV